MFPIGNVAAFAAAVRRLIEQPALRHDLQIRAHQRVESAFSTHASARQLAARLHEIVDRADAAGRTDACPRRAARTAGAAAARGGDVDIRLPSGEAARLNPWRIQSRVAG